MTIAVALVFVLAGLDKSFDSMRPASPLAQDKSFDSMRLAPPLPQDKFDSAAEKITLPAKEALDAIAAKSENHKKAVALIADRKTWAAGLKRIEEKLGLFNEAPKIEVKVEDSDDPKPGRAGGEGGNGAIKLNVRRWLAVYQKIEEFEKAKNYGKDPKWRVPPAKLDALVHHELVHCFVPTSDENWWTEGIASWVAGDESIVWAFVNDKRPVGPLDQMVPEDDAYGRGWAFIEWVRSLGEEKWRGFLKTVLADKTKVKAAAETASGKVWSDLVPAERDWAKAFMKKYSDRLGK